MSALSHPPAAPVTPSLVRLLDIEPDFGLDIEATELADARSRAVVPVVSLPAGEWSPSAFADPGAAIPPFALLIVDGLVARHTSLSDRVSTQLAGPGDILPLRAPDEILPPTERSWEALTPIQVAIFDVRFLAAAQRWPWLTARVIERSVRWADRSSLLQSISQLGRVDLRVLAMLWHLAERWGRVATEGVCVPVKLTHEALGRLVGAQRPTVTLALRDLRERGVVNRHVDGWVLAADSCELLATLEDPSTGVDGRFSSAA